MKEKETKPTQHEPTNTISLPKRDKGKKVWIIISTLLFISTVGLGIFGYIRFNEFSKKASSQQAQIDDLSNRRQQLEAAVAEAARSAVKTTKGVAADIVSGQNDRDMITATITAECARQYDPDKTIGLKTSILDIKTIDNNFAQGSYACENAAHGPEVVLVKVSGNWVIVASGIGEDIVPPAVRSKYNIPANIGKTRQN